MDIGNMHPQEVVARYYYFTCIKAFTPEEVEAINRNVVFDITDIDNDGNEIKTIEVDWEKMVFKATTLELQYLVKQLAKNKGIKVEEVPVAMEGETQEVELKEDVQETS